MGMPERLKHWNIHTYDQHAYGMPGTQVKLSVIQEGPEAGLILVEVYDRGVWAEAFKTDNPRILVDRL